MCESGQQDRWISSPVIAVTVPAVTGSAYCPGRAWNALFPGHPMGRMCVRRRSWFTSRTSACHIGHRLAATGACRPPRSFTLSRYMFGRRSGLRPLGCWARHSRPGYLELTLGPLRRAQGRCPVGPRTLSSTLPECSGSRPYSEETWGLTSHVYSYDF